MIPHTPKYMCAKFHAFFIFGTIAALNNWTIYDLPKFPHSAMFVGVMACSKTEFLLRLPETEYKNHFEFILILCPTILDNKTYLSEKWILNDENVFIVCDEEGKLNE